MNTVKFQYEMRLEFENPVHDHYFTLRCFPKKTVRQNILEMKTIVEPFDMLCESRDGFGNTTYIGHKLGMHTYFSVSVEGLASVDWNQYETDDKLNMCYKIQTPFTMPTREMHQYFDEKYKPGISHFTEYQMAEFIMHDVHRMFTYEKAVTGVNTVAGTAFSQKTGVCQDYAHVMLSFARLALLPARYVVGIMIGEGESHAWVEVFCGGKWYGFDPTNNLLIGNNYIILAKGRDAKDCLINQGKFYGVGKQTQKINAKVEIVQ